jgi:hypothetical protein
MGEVARVKMIDPQQRETLDELISQHGLSAGHYAFFFVTGEGRILPDGETEESSGYVIDDRGRVFAFWLGWDMQHRRPVFLDWREEAPEPAWSRSDEYRAARRAVGLANS